MTDRIVRFRYSRDGGRNFSRYRERSLGQVGEFCKRIKFHALGQGVQWVFDISTDSAAPVDLIAMSAQLESGE